MKVGGAPTAPDDYSGLCAQDLSQEDFDRLAVVWPAAFALIESYLADVEAGRLHPASSTFDCPIGLMVAMGGA